MTLQDKLVEGKMVKKSTRVGQIHHNFVVLIYSGMGLAQCFPTPSCHL